MSNKLGTPLNQRECNPCYQSAVRGHCGRPNNLVTYEYGDVSGATLEEFNAAWDASGGKRWIANFDGVGGGECHWYCPALEGQDFIIDGVVQAEFIVSPNPNAEALGCESEKAQPTIGCLDDDILKALSKGNSCDDPIHAVICGVTTEECCIPPDLEKRDRWCQRYNATFPVGDSDPDRTYFIVVNGVNVPLPNPYTEQDLMDALFQAAPTGQWAIIGEPKDQYLCRFDQSGGVGFGSCYSPPCEDRICIKQCSISAITSLFIPGDEDSCRNYIRTWGKYEEPIANILEGIKDCPKPLPLECLKKRTFCVGYDNGVTPGSSSNDCGARDGFVRFDWEFEVIGWDVNGTTVGAGEIIGPFTGWTPQLQGWSDFFNANDPNFVEGECFAEFGFLPAPTWRYSKINCCNPNAKYGPLKLKRISDGCTFTIYPILEQENIETVNRYATLDFSGNKKIQWCDSAGNDIETPSNPDCFVPCDFVFNPFTYGPSVDCEQMVYNVCDDATDPSTAFVSVVTTCDGVRETENWTLESWTTAQSFDDLVPYELQGTIVNCATGEAFEFPVSLDQQMLDKLCESNEILKTLPERIDALESRPIGVCEEVPGLCGYVRVAPDGAILAEYGPVAANRRSEGLFTATCEGAEVGLLSVVEPEGDSDRDDMHIRWSDSGAGGNLWIGEGDNGTAPQNLRDLEWTASFYGPVKRLTCSE